MKRESKEELRLCKSEHRIRAVVLVHTYNPSTQEAQEYPEFEFSLVLASSGSTRVALQTLSHKTNNCANEMAQYIKAFASKTDHLGSVPWVQMVEGKN